MKLNGKIIKLRPRYKELKLGLGEDGAPVVVRLHAPKMGLIERLMRDMTAPEAPSRGVVKDKRGETQRDEFGKPIVIRDTQDPAYVALVAERNRLMTVGAFVEVTAGQFEFEAKREAFPDLTGYLRAITVELEAAGLDRGTFLAIDHAIAELTKMAEDDAGEAREALGAPPAPKVPEGK